MQKKKSLHTLKTMITADFVKEFTEAMTHEGVEDMMKLRSLDGEWVIMATGETFKGLDRIWELAIRSVAARTHGSGEGLLPFNVVTNAEGTKLVWEYVHKGVDTEQWPASTNKPTVGTAFDLPIILTRKIHEGKFTKIREYFDLLTLLKPAPHTIFIPK